MSYQSVILADSPVGYWPLDDTSGTVAQDISGNGNNMAYQNFPTLGAASIAAGLGASVNLSGSYQMVDLAEPPASLQLVKGSFEIWCKQSTVNMGATLFSNESVGTNARNFNIGQGGLYNNPPQTDYLFAGSYDGSSWAYAGYVSALSANIPYHVVYTNDGTTANLYINGALAYTGTGATFSPNSAAIYIGTSWDSAYFIEGLMSNAAIYNTVLTPAQILNHYNAGNGTTPPPPPPSTGSPLYTGGGTDAQFLLLQR